MRRRCGPYDPLTGDRLVDNYPWAVSRGGKEMGDAFKSPSLWLDLDLLVVAGFDPSYDGKDGKLRVSYVIFKGF